MPSLFSATDATTLGEQGLPMPVQDLLTGLPLLRGDGKPVVIMLTGRHGERFRAVMRQIQLRRGEMLALKEPVTPALREQEDIETLIACTRDWTIDSLDDDGAPFPCTPDNIAKLWNDPRSRSLREPAMAFILTDANFLPARFKPSAVSPDTSSSTADLSPEKALAA